MKYGKLTPLAFALGMLFAGQSLAAGADTIVWDKNSALSRPSDLGKNLSIELSSGNNLWRPADYTMNGLDKLDTTKLIWKTVTTKEGAK